MRSEYILLALAAAILNTGPVSSRQTSLFSFFQRQPCIETSSSLRIGELKNNVDLVFPDSHIHARVEKVLKGSPNSSQHASALKKRDMFDDFSLFTSRAASFFGADQKSKDNQSPTAVPVASSHATRNVQGAINSAQPAQASESPQSPSETAVQSITQKPQKTHATSPTVSHPNARASTSLGAPESSSSAKRPTTTSTMISTTTRTSTLSSRLTSRSSIITPSLQHSPSSITPISTNLAASQTSLPSSVPSNGRLSNAAIGAVVGVAVLGALSILGMAIFFLRRRRQRRSEKLMEDDGLLSGAARPGFGGGGKPIDDMEDGRPDGIAMSDNLNVNSHQSPAPVYFRNRLSGNWFQPGHRGSRATIFQNPLGLHRPDSYDHRTNTFVWPAAAPDPSQRYNDKSGQQPDFEMHRKPVPPNLQLRIPNSQQVPPLHAYRSLSSLYQRPNDPQQTHQELSGDPVRHLSPMAVHEESTKVDGAHIPRSLTPGKASPGA